MYVVEGAVGVCCGEREIKCVLVEGRDGCMCLLQYAFL